MKISIEIIVPKGINLSHCLNVVTDAMNVNSNVTDQEYEFVEEFLTIAKSIAEQ
jgi:hypothetical protein